MHFPARICGKRRNSPGILETARLLTAESELSNAIRGDEGENPAIFYLNIYIHTFYLKYKARLLRKSEWEKCLVRERSTQQQFGAIKRPQFLSRNIP